MYIPEILLYVANLYTSGIKNGGSQFSGICGEIWTLLRETESDLAAISQEM